jgi:hypothetical protein
LLAGYQSAEELRPIPLQGFAPAVRG